VEYKELSFTHSKEVEKFLSQLTMHKRQKNSITTLMSLIPY